MIDSVRVTSSPELLRALASGARDIEIAGSLRGLPRLTLPPGVSLRGGLLETRSLRLTADNMLCDITVHATDGGTAITNLSTTADLGALVLRRVRTRGRVLLQACGAVRAGHIEIDGLFVESVELRSRAGHPAGTGTGAHLGTITVCNRSSDPGAALSARLRGLRVGTAAQPVAGPGVMVGGCRPDGGSMRVTRLDVDEVHVTGAAEAAGSLLCAAVLILPATAVHRLTVRGELTCAAPRGIAFGNWGSVTACTLGAAITCSGSDGVGILNAGLIRDLAVRGPVTTYGRDGHGMDLRAGSVRSAALTSVATHGDGAVAVRVGAELGALDVGGAIASYGVRTPAVEIGGLLGAVRVAGGITAHGPHANAVLVHPGRPFDLEGVEISAPGGRALDPIRVSRSRRGSIEFDELTG